MKVFLLGFVSFLIITFFIAATSNTNSGVSKLPVLISYMKKPAPDSIQDFMKIYLQTKKIEVINWKQAMDLQADIFQTQMLLLINSGKLNEQTAGSFIKNMQPFCNVLAVTVFTDSINKENYIIDSIRWYVDIMPVKDTTNKIFKIFIPQSDNKSNPYIVLKSFTDVVLQSKLLK